MGARGGLASTTPSSASCRPPPDFDDTILCTLRAAVRQPAPAGCWAAVRLEACWLRLHHLLHATGRSPAAGSCRLQGCCSRGLAGSDTTTPCTPAAGSCRLHCCDARGGSLAPTTTSSALYGPQSGNRLLPVAGLRRAGRLAGSDYTILCTLRAAIRQPAPAGCRAAARGEARWLRLHHLLHSAGRRPAAGFGRLPSCSALGVPAPTTPCSVICEQLSCNRLRLAVGGCPPLHYMPLPQPSNRITPSHTCTIHLMGPTPTPVALSGESIHSPVGPLSFFLRP